MSRGRRIVRDRKSPPGRERLRRHVLRDRRLLPLLVSPVLALTASLLPAPAVSRADPSPTAATAASVAEFTSSDVGIVQGVTPDDGRSSRRLDGIASFTAGTSPILRIDLDWWYVEDCRGCPLRWDRLDGVVDAAAERGMRVLLILAYAPPWANGGHADDKWFPTRDADWVSIVDRTVRHFGDKVQAYEVWNEPNLQQFGNYDGDRKQRYWELVRLAHERVHAACADCVVVAGASGSGSPATEQSNPNESAVWLDWAYARGYGRYFDAVAHHPYPAWNSGKGPSQKECRVRWWNMFGPPDEAAPCGELAQVHKVMVQRGDTSKKIWATEWGYPTAGMPAIPSREVVRDHLLEGVQMWRSLSYTGPLFLYSYQDQNPGAGPCTEPDTNPECHFGVVDSDFRPKEPIYSDLSAALTDTWQPSLRTGQTLRRWSSMRSQDGALQLWLQGDGNLVLYRRDGRVMWATGTRGAVRLVNQSDGNLVLYRADGSAAWSSGTRGRGASTLWLQEDGNLVLYDSRGTATWATGTAVAGSM